MDRRARLALFVAVLLAGATTWLAADRLEDTFFVPLDDILAGKDSSKSVGGLSLENLSADDRRTILEIVRETKLNLPAYWTAASAR